MRISTQAIAEIEQQLHQSVPWELYIEALSTLPKLTEVGTKQSPLTLDNNDLSAIAQAALGARRLLGVTKRNLAALNDWLGEPATGVTIDRARQAARVVAEFGEQAIRIRAVDVHALAYQAPPSKQITRLLFRADQALACLDPIARDFMSGSCVCVIRPFSDGNGRVSRLYFLRALLRVGCSAVQAASLLRNFDGDGSRESIMVRQAATYAGDPLPFLDRWRQVLVEARISV